MIIYCDGGCFGNGTDKQDGYGSYRVEGKPTIYRQTFGNVTNNQSELMILRHVLRQLKQHMVKSEVTIRMDSQLVVNTVTGVWAARDQKLVPLVGECQALLRETYAKLEWVGRDTIVAQVGH